MDSGVNRLGRRAQSNRWLVLCAIGLLGWVATGRADEGFTEDVDAAVRQAKEQQKDLMVLFTGSDWCPPCKKLESEVFTQPEFAEGAERDFVLVKLDFPQQLPQTEAIKQRNEEWAQRYGITGFPTIAVLDASLRPVGFLGYMEGGPVPFLNALSELRERRVRRDLAFDKLPETQDPEQRAQLLDQGLSALEENVVQVYYLPELEEIGEIDDDNRLGLRTKYFAEQDKEMRKIIMTDILIVSRLETPDRAVAFIDEVLEAVSFPVEEKFEVLQIKLSLLQRAERLEEADRLLDDMLAMEGLLEETRERLLVKKLMQFVSAGQEERATRLIGETLAQPGEHLLVQLTQGQLMASRQEYSEAIAVFSRAISQARFKPDILIELVGAKADAQYKAGEQEEALKTLDTFAEDTQMPTDLRCEALLHQAMIMRDMARVRPAMLMENRAVELADSPQLKREIQTVVEKLRAKKD